MTYRLFYSVNGSGRISSNGMWESMRDHYEHDFEAKSDGIARKICKEFCSREESRFRPWWAGSEGFCFEALKRVEQQEVSYSVA